MCKIARQIDEDTLQREPSVFTVVNSSSPLRLDAPMLQGIIEFSSRNQVVVMTPFTLAGAMAPITLAGAVAQQNAEALAGMVFTQVVRPGSPVIYGGFTSNVDMQSGAPAFGTPEYVRTAMLGGQLARRYQVPYRSSNVSAANALDAQAAYESVFSLWGAVMGGVNFLMHGGRMDGGRAARLDGQVRARRRPAGDGRRPARPDRRRRGHTCRRRHPRGRTGRALLRRRSYPGALPHGVPPPDGLGLAELRDVGRGRPSRGGGQGGAAGSAVRRALRTPGHGPDRARASSTTSSPGASPRAASRRISDVSLSRPEVAQRAR